MTVATDWSARTAALEYFEKQLKLAKRANDEDRELLEQAVNALRRSQDHTAIQNRLNEATKIIRKIAANPDCASASCGRACKEFLTAQGKG